MKKTSLFDLPFSVKSDMSGEISRCEVKSLQDEICYAGEKEKHFRKFGSAFDFLFHDTRSSAIMHCNLRKLRSCQQEDSRSDSPL